VKKEKETSQMGKQEKLALYSKMKILHVFDIFSPHTNGTVTLLYQLSKTLAYRGHEVTIFSSDFRIDQQHINSLGGVRVCPFRSWFNLAGFRVIPGMIKVVKRELKGFDIIHLHSYRSFANVVIHRYAQQYGVPYIVDSHGSIPRLTKGKLKWFFDITVGNRILKNASRVIAETEVGIAESKEAGANQDKIVLLPPPPCDVSEFSQLPPPGLFRHKFNIKGKYIIMFLGRIHWVKGLDFLIESFYELARYRRDVILVIVGPDDGYKSILETLINKLNLSDMVLFTGFLSGKEKLSALVDASVVVQTSRHEQGAGAPIEAVLCDTPIIVSRDTGAGEDVRRMDAGYLMEFGNKDDFREKIEYVLNNPTEAKIKTRKAKEYIKSNLSMAKKVEEYENLYATCIEESEQIVRRRR